jgi:hypothetical protein
MRNACVAGIALAAASLLCPVAVAQERQTGASRNLRTIEFEGRRWVTDSASQVSIEEYEGKTALFVRGGLDGLVYLPDVVFRDGTIEVDFATRPRGIPGIGFRGSENGERLDKVIFNRWRWSSATKGGAIGQAVITRRRGTLLALRIPVPKEDDSGRNLNIHGWFHVKVVVHGKRVAVYLNGAEGPSIEVNEMIDDTGRGTLGVLGNHFYFANFRYTPADPVADETIVKAGKRGPVPLAEHPDTSAPREPD